MDDFPQIVESDMVRGGVLFAAHLSAWTHLWYVIQYHLFGMSPAGFHAVNWLLHTAAACLLFCLGRDFLRGKWPAGVALFGALLFAVHPLASEIPNYARTQDLTWVTLFSLAAGWLLLGFLRGGPRWKLAASAACVAGAMFSKGPGLFHALMVCAAVGLPEVSSAHWKTLREKWRWIAGTTAVLLAGLGLTGLLNGLLNGIYLWAEPRFIGHGYTVARVFWEFSWRAVVPLGLSSDHLVTETLIPPGTKFWNIPDKIAMLSLFGLFALAGFGGWLAWRKKTRIFGICLLLYVGTMLFRLLYLIPEFMPEYRIYPGLPWFCLGAAILLTAVWKWLFETLSPAIPATILLVIFAALSARRSFVWHDIDRLMDDVLTRYPARARAIWELDDRDTRAGNWQAIIDRQKRLWPDVERHFVEDNQRLAPAREIPSGDFVLAMVAIFGRYGNAVAHVESPAAGLGVMAQLEAHMKQMKMDPLNKPVEWGHFYHDKALILEMAGDYTAAAECLRRKYAPASSKKDLLRIEKKLAGS